MSKLKAHVSERKKKEVIKLKRLIKDYPVIGLVDITSLPSPQLQKMRKNLKDDMTIYVSKKRLIQMVLDQSKDIKGIGELKSYLRGMPALILSKEDPFKLAKVLRNNKSRAPAKPGQVAPNNILVNKGPTSFAPGPIISELTSVGLKASVEAGKIVIKEDKVVAKEGDIIGPKLADVLAKLKIEPMEVGLNVSAILQDGVIYGKDILSIDEKQYLENLRVASREAFALGLSVGYVTKENINFLIQRTYNEAKALLLESKFVTSENIKDVLSKIEQEVSAVKEKIEEGAALPEEEIDVKEEVSEALIEQETEEEIDVKEDESVIDVYKETEKIEEPKKPAENIVEETIEKVKGGKMIREKPETYQGPTKELMEKTVEIVKELTDRKADSERKAQGKKKKEKEFREAEKKAQEVLGKL